MSVSLIALVGAIGCSLLGPATQLSVSEKLARVGLEELTSREARLPDRDRSRYLPIRVVSGHPSPAVPDDPAGYLIVGIRGRLATDVAEIRAAITAWRPGESLVVQVRRNPYLQPSNEWWEKDVRLPWPR